MDKKQQDRATVIASLVAILGALVAILSSLASMRH